jgi:hypothetical protein
VPEAMKNVSPVGGGVGLEGFEQIFDETIEMGSITASGVLPNQEQLEKVLGRLTELVAFSVDQRVENARMAGQLIENQRQLVATQQILIRLMEKSIELTKHISTIEEKLPLVFELPKLVDSLKDRLVRMEGIEIN